MRIWLNRTDPIDRWYKVTWAETWLEKMQVKLAYWLLKRVGKKYGWAKTTTGSN